MKAQIKIGSESSIFLLSQSFFDEELHIGRRHNLQYKLSGFGFLILDKV